MVEQVDPLVAHLEEDDVSVFLRRFHHEWEPASRELDQRVTGEARAWSWRRPAIWRFARHRVSVTNVIQAI
jgi:CRISPR/Cas system-associated exonuclease Cas4 (RecB family)